MGPDKVRLRTTRWRPARAGLPGRWTTRPLPEPSINQPEPREVVIEIVVGDPAKADQPRPESPEVSRYRLDPVIVLPLHDPPLEPPESHGARQPRGYAVRPVDGYEAAFPRQSAPE